MTKLALRTAGRPANTAGRGVQGGHHVLRPEGVEDIDGAALERELSRSVRGEVRFDAGHRAIYSHDSSNYRQPPLGVVMPRDADDLAAAVAACRAHGAPVLPRGCGTSLSGETCNVAVVLDVSKHMRRIHEIDPEGRTARVEPGVVHDQLTSLTEPAHHLTFGPDTSTHQWATVGGMIGNNSCGMHSVMAGRTSDNLEEMEIVTYDGLRMRVGATSEEELGRIVAAGGRRGEIYGRMRDLRDRYADEIRARYPQIPRRVSGYNLDDLLPEKGFHVGRALTGSEGTLATVLDATLRLVHMPPVHALVVMGYPTIADAADHVSEIMEHEPIALEALDDKLIHDMRVQRQHLKEITLLPDGGGWLLVQFGGETREEAEERARRCMKAVAKAKNAPNMVLADDPGQESRLWEVREAGLGATAYVPGEPDHVSGWEDAAVPPGREGDYIRDFEKLMDSYGYTASLYGHFGQGCVHCSISFDLDTNGGLEDYRRFLDEAADLVVSYGGSLSGEHGDGQQRAELLPKMFGEDLVRAFGEFKDIWDPDHKMNPHKVVDPYPIVSNMKRGADYSPPAVETHFSYAEHGGSFSRAALRCVGAGKCRDVTSGTMCPSYMVTLDEQHSTRGRARILYEMLQGETITEGFRSDEVHEALDLCLSCKGCKGDCPVKVDMATYKAEFLSGYFKGRLRPREAYSMGLIMLHARVAQVAPRLVNAATRAPVLGGLVKRAGGISPKRAMPPFATESFKSWWASRPAVNPHADPVVLFPDTFNNYLHPEPMKATVEVLEAAGYRVTVPEEALCCGRPLYDYGMLTTARAFLRRLVDVLRPHVQAGAYVVGVEPSCVASFRDELPNLMPQDEDAKRIAGQTLTLAEFLVREAEHWEAPRLDRRVLVHGHCHQEAVMGLSAERELYEGMGLEFEVLDSGCCGLAGSFGFEKRHRDISVAIGERRLLPAVREAAEDTILVADGFSCKTQIEQLTDRRALHTAQLLQMAMDHGPGGVASSRPETAYPDVTLDGGGPVTPRSLAVGGALVACGLAARQAARRRL